MKKVLLLSGFALFLSSCSLFERAKPTIIKKTSVIVKEQAIKVLKCKTGEAVAADFSAKLSELLKVKERTVMASASSAKSLGSSFCVQTSKLILPFFVDLADKQLPISWVEDGCSLEGVGEDLGELANRLCEKI